MLRSFVFALFTHNDCISQTNSPKAARTLPVAGAEDHPQHPAVEIRFEDAVVVEASPRNFHLLRRCRVSGMNNDRCYDPSSSLGPLRPPHFFKRPRNSSNLPPKTQVNIHCPQSGLSAENPNPFRADATGEGSVPTAGKVSRVFSNTHPHLFDNSLIEVEEGIEEVDFEDLALVHERVLDPDPATLSAPTVQRENFTGTIRKPAPEPEVQPEETSDVTLVTTETTFRTETEACTVTDVELLDGPVIKASADAVQLVTPVQEEHMFVETQISITSAESGPVTIPTESPPLFVIDTNPSASRQQIPVPAYDVRPHTVSLGEIAGVKVEPDPEDDVIVYEAPNPRLSTPRVELAALTNIPFPNHTPSSTPRQINPLQKGKFVHVVGKNARRGSGGILGVKRKRLVEHGTFAAFGAMFAEARLRSQDDGKDRDPKEHLRRQGDSDVDWGGETDEGKGDPTAATAEGMDLDPDLVGSVDVVTAMERFVEGINANHVRTDDLEDQNGRKDSSSDDEMDEDEGVESDEEMMLIEEFLAAQDDSDSSDEGDDDDDELDPRAGFQARLDRLRRKQQKVIEMEDGEDEDEMDQDFEWGEWREIDVRPIYPLKSCDLCGTPRIWSEVPSVNTGRTVGHVTRFLGPSRMAFSKSHSPKLPRQVRPSVVSMVSPPTDDSVERKDLPTGLQEQWEKDRLNKAKQKSERELARLEAILDPLVTKKGGKKSKKAMIAAARLDPLIEIRHRIADMVSVEQQIRRFLADKGRKDMALPASDKSTRKKIHNLAALFGLKSKSKNGALGRYTTLMKTKHSGGNIDERQVARMMEGFKYRASYDVSDDDWDDMRKGKGKGKGKAKGKGKFKKEKDQPEHLKTREGDVVGHVRA